MKRAKEIEQVMLLSEKTKKPFLVTDIWPHFNAIIGVTSGSFSFYANKVRQHLPPHIKIFSPFYACTESLLGLNLTANKNTYLLHPLVAFFEFIPIEEYDKTNPKTLFMNQIELGKEYELVITCPLGLYRYRLGDIIKVVGFYNTIPEVEFCYRIGCLINRTGEKVSESDFQLAVSEAAQIWKVSLRDYTILDDPDANYYHIVMETMEETPISNIKTQVLDETLSKYSPIFGAWLREAKLKGVKISLLKSNTFNEFKRFLIEEFKVYSEQLKIPRLVRNEKQIEFFEKNIIASQHGVENS